MGSYIRLLPVVTLASLALAGPASAQYYDTYSQGDWNTSSQGYDQDQAWDNSSQDWSSPSSPSQDASDGWSPNQGDPQETPHIWQQTPPVSPPVADNGGSAGGNSQPSGGNTLDSWPVVQPLDVSNTPTVAGKTAMIRRNGLAAIPRGAPTAVRAIIAAANQIIGKPYKWGGGHGRLFDSGYDCSGSVSYALIRAGVLSYPMVSGTLAHWGAKGVGRYVTIYANKSHVYMEVAGLRLDTSAVGDPIGKSGVRWRPPIGKRFGFAVRHVPGL